MHPDKRRAGRRIRRQRRKFRNIGQAFNQVAQATSIAAANFTTFAIAIGEAVNREEDIARAKLAGGPEPLEGT